MNYKKNNKPGYLRLRRINYKMFIDSKSYPGSIVAVVFDKELCCWCVKFDDVLVLKGLSFTFCRDNGKHAIEVYIKRKMKGVS